MDISFTKPGETEQAAAMIPTSDNGGRAGGGGAPLRYQAAD
jgi:hypothetical protein